jgi:hypothetical protein
MKAFLLFLALSVLTGCGLVTHGTSQNIRCTTVPAGAVVKAADGTTCSTPCTVTLKRKNDDLLTIEREGYETITLSVHSVLSKSSASNILLPGGLVCWGVDLASGAAYHLVPGSVDLTLKPDAGNDAPKPPG